MRPSLNRLSSALSPHKVRKYANIPSSSEQDDVELRVDFDPALQFYVDLKRIYAGTLEFFFDVHGGSVIGAVWDPSVLSPRPFRVLADYSSAPVPEDHDHEDAEKKTKKEKERKGGKRKEVLVELNRAAVLAEIERLGSGLVQAIEIQKA